MADEKKTVNKKETSNADKKPNIFVRIGKAIAKFFKDLKGEVKKIVWPGRQMVIKSTGIVLASILVIGAGVWILDFAISGAVTGLGKIAESVEETTVEDKEDKEEKESEKDTTEEHDHDHDEKAEETTEAKEKETTEKAAE